MKIAADTSHVWQGHYKRTKELDHRYKAWDALRLRVVARDPTVDESDVWAAWEHYTRLRDSNWCMAGDVH